MNEKKKSLYERQVIAMERQAEALERQAKALERLAQCARPSDSIYGDGKMYFRHAK